MRFGKRRLLKFVPLSRPASSDALGAKFADHFIQSKAFDRLNRIFRMFFLPARHWSLVFCCKVGHLVLRIKRFQETLASLHSANDPTSRGTIAARSDSVERRA